MIGDVHGCLDELEDLLELAGFERDSDQLIFLGDLINRGPDSLGVLELVHELGADCLLGNHERGFLRFLKKGDKHLSEFAWLKQQMGKRLPFWKKWMEDLPLFIRVEGVEQDGLIVVHAGLVPGQPPELTDQGILTNIREWDGPAGDVNFLTPTPWFEKYHDPVMVVFGHWAQKGFVARDNVIGLDTGCVWGGNLTAFSMPDRTLFQVPARAVYFRDP